jgi:hypothetical protein
MHSVHDQFVHMYSHKQTETTHIHTRQDTFLCLTSDLRTDEFDPTYATLLCLILQVLCAKEKPMKKIWFSSLDDVATIPTLSTSVTCHYNPS